MMEYPLLMARYNRWMNEKIYSACATVSDEERKLDRKAPFGSLHGLLNHIFWADSLWLARFGAIEFQPRPLGEVVYEDFEALKIARVERDCEIELFASTLTEEKLSGTLHFASVAYGISCDIPMSVAVTHFFNHQTHHRGQITVLLEQTGVDFGITDLAMMPDVA